MTDSKQELICAARKVLSNIERLDRNRLIGSLLSSDPRENVRLDTTAIKKLRKALITAEAAR